MAHVTGRSSSTPSSSSSSSASFSPPTSSSRVIRFPGGAAWSPGTGFVTQAGAAHIEQQAFTQRSREYFQNNPGGVGTYRGGSSYGGGGSGTTSYRVSKVSPFKQAQLNTVTNQTSGFMKDKALTSVRTQDTTPKLRVTKDTTYTSDGGSYNALMQVNIRKEAREASQAAALVELNVGAYEKGAAAYNKAVEDFNEQYGGKSLGASDYNKAQQEIYNLQQQEQTLESRRTLTEQSYKTAQQELEEFKQEESRYNQTIGNIRQQRDFKQVLKGIRTKDTPSGPSVIRDTGLVSDRIIQDLSITKDTFGLEPAKISRYQGRTDITKKEFEDELKKQYKEIAYETSFENTIQTPADRTRILQQKKEIGGYDTTLGSQWFGKDFGRTAGMFFEGIGETFDYGTDLIGYGLGYGTPSKIYTGGEDVFIRRETERATLSKQFKDIKNPFEASIMQLKSGRTKQLIEDVKSDFYFSKQAAESAMFLTGGPITTLATVGSIARAKRTEEVLFPLALGAGARLLTPFVGAKASVGIAKINKKLDNALSKIFTSKLPVVKNVLVPSRFGNILNESVLAKSLIYGGVTAETLGIGFVPLEQKREYIRQVGLYNALVPLGYKGMDVAIPTAKFIGIKGISKGTDYLGKLTSKDLTPYDIYTSKELMDPSVYEKWSRTGGGTPTFRGTEAEMLAQTQGLQDYGVGAVYKNFDFDPLKAGRGSGLRSVGTKLTDDIIPGRAYYETAWADYYSSTLHPIAVKGVGLKQRLLRKPTSLFYDQISFAPKQPSIIFTTAKRASALSFYDDLPLTRQAYESLESAFGYQKMDFSFSEDVFFRKNKIPFGETLGDFQYEKVLRKGRGIKTGDFLKAGFTEEIFDYRIYQPGSMTDDLGGFFSSRPRAQLTTSEAEYVLKAPAVRAPPITKTRGFFRKLGFSDAYVDVGFEYLPMNYYITKDTPVKFLNAGQKMLEPVKLDNRTQYFQPESPVKQGQSYFDNKYFQPEALTKQYDNYIKNYGDLVSGSKGLTLTRGTAKGGYTKELEAVFGTRNKPISAFFEKAIYPKPAYGLFGTKTSKLPKYSSKDVYYDLTRPYKEPKYPKYPDIYRTPKLISYKEPKYRTPKYPEYRTLKTPDYDIPRYPDYSPPRYPDPKPVRYPDIYRGYPALYKPKSPRLKVPKSAMIDFKDSKYDLGRLYNAYVRRGKNYKWKKVTKQALPQNLAFNKGLYVADNTIGQSVKIKKTNKRGIIPDDPFINSQKFRRRKRGTKIPGPETIFVEKRKHAIDTQGEKANLSIAKFMKGSWF